VKDILDASVAVFTWTEGYVVLQSEWNKGSQICYEHLEMIHEGIRRDIGAEQAFNFSSMVFSLNDFNIYPFSVAFEEFWANNFKILKPTFFERHRNIENTESYGDSYFIRYTYNVSHFDEEFPSTFACT